MKILVHFFYRTVMIFPVLSVHSVCNKDYIELTLIYYVNICFIYDKFVSLQIVKFCNILLFNLIDKI